MDETGAPVATAELDHLCAQWRVVFDGMSEPVFAHDAAFRLVYANRAYLHSAGADWSTAKGLPYWEVYPRLGGPLPGCCRSTAIGSGGYEEWFAFNGASGRSVAFTVSGDAGAVFGIHLLDTPGDSIVAGVMTTALRHSGEAVIATDALGRILFVNPAFERLLGRRHAELAGQGLAVLAGTSADGAEPYLAETSGDEWEGDLVWKTRDGAPVPIRLALTKVREGSGRLLALVGNVLDRRGDDRLRSELDDRDWALGERAKELRGLYAVAALAANPHMELPEFLDRVVALIPAAWQYPDRTTARLRINDEIYASPEWREGTVCLGRRLRVGDVVVGSLVIGYAGPPAEGDPFLAEEAALVAALADQIEATVGGHWARAESQALARLSLESPSPILRIAADGTLLYANPAAQACLDRPLAVGERYEQPWTDAAVRAFERQTHRAFEVHCGERTFAFVAVPVPEGNYVNLYGTDVEALRRSEGALRRRLALENLLASVTASFVNVASTAFDDAVETALLRIGQFAGADRSYLFQFSADGAAMSNTHEWCAAGVAPQRDSLQAIPTEAMPWFMARIVEGTLQVPDVEALPDAAAPEREVLRAQSIRSLVIVPMREGERLLGYIGFDSVRDARPWPGEDVRLLELTAQVLGDALQRRDAERRVARLNRALQALSRADETVIHASSEADLIRGICDTVVQVGGYPAAWVGFAEPEGRIRIVERAGDAVAYVDELRVSWGDDPLGQGPSGKAIRTGVPQVCRSAEQDACFLPWRSRAARYGLAACTTLPLLDHGTAFGLIAIYASITDAFDDEEVRLLRQLADALAFGILAQREQLQRKATAVALRASEERFELAVRGAKDGIWDWNIVTNEVYWSDRVYELLGYGSDERHSSIESLSELLHPDDREPTFAALRRHLEEGAAYDLEYRLLTKSGEYRWFGVRGEAVRDTTGKPVRMAGSVTDVTERKQAEAMLQISFRALDSARNGIMITAGLSPDSPIIYVNPAFESITGYGAEEVVGQLPSFLLDGTDNAGRRQNYLALSEAHETSMVVCNRRKDGSQFWNELHVSPVRDPAGTITHHIGVINDVTERLRYQKELEFRAQHDELTGLPNRNLMRDRLAQAMIWAERHERTVAVIFLGLDRFKVVNDSLGHRTGDELLRAVAQRLGHLGRKGDTVSRYGGDEFVIVLADVAREEDVTDVAHRIQAAVAEPLSVDAHDLRLTATLGISLYPRDGADPDLLIRNADAAMYQAKEVGRGTLQFYTAEMNVRMLERLTLDTRLRSAVEGGELRLHYQPQVRLRDGALCGVEALVRWEHPDLGLIPPVRFIPHAEETGIIVQLGEWVLREACAQIVRWQAAGLRPVPVAVNVSARQLERDDLESLVARVLRETGIDPDLLELELTESALAGDPESMAQKLDRLKALGCRLALDDFGTGYSSLTYLKRFPFDRLKIDRTFVTDVTSDPNDAAIAKTIIAMARSLRLEVLAEGVEGEAQLNYLKRSGCDVVQGYFFGKPQPADALEPLLRTGRFEAGAESAHGAERTVLIVDDEPNITRAIKRVLHRDGYQVLTTNDPLAAFDLLALHPVGVIVSDQRMPGMTGTELLSRVKDIYPDVVRIVLSGYTELKTVTDAVNRGWVFRFLTKPWDDEDLRAQIREAFTQHERLRAASAETDSVSRS